MLLKSVLKQFSDQFKSLHFENPEREAEHLVCDFLGLTRSQLYVRLGDSLSEKDYCLVNEWLQRRLKGEPLAYISGKVDFYHCSFFTHSSVLIPRPETEIFVDKIVTSLKKTDLKGKELWDLCCGSGCIGISIKKALPELTVVLSDCSAEAIALTKKNAMANAVEIECFQGDFLSPFAGRKTDYFVCNPPYISKKDYDELSLEVKNFEPSLALLAGVTGLEFYERLSKELFYYLKPHARAWFEIGYDQGLAIQKLFSEPVWKHCFVENDWAGHNRFFFLEIE